MLKFTIKRILQAIIVLFGVYTLTFIVIKFIPGDPVAIMMNKKADAAMMERIRHQMGLDRPLIEQYFTSLSKLLHGDFGYSYVKKVDVIYLIKNGFVNTVNLGLRAFAYSVIVGFTIGVITALNRGKLIDRLGIIIVVMFVSVPAFWLAVLLQLLFGVKLGLLPVSGMKQATWWILPTLTLGAPRAASMARLTRTNILEAISQDYVRTAYSKGLKSRAVVIKHVLKNAAIPTVTLFGLQIPHIFGGAMIIEKVFSIPGIGSVSLDGIRNRDLPTIQGMVIYTTVIFVIVNLVVDLLYGLLDPRIRITAKGGA